MTDPKLDVLDTLGKAKYISLATYKKNGDEVKTPVWVVHLGDRLAVWTDGTSYKVKRLRKNPEFKAAECNASGKKILGPWHGGKAQIIEDPGRIDEVRRALKAKYGWQVTLIDFVQRFRRRRQSDAVIIELSF